MIISMIPSRDVITRSAKASLFDVRLVGDTVVVDNIGSSSPDSGPIKRINVFIPFLVMSPDVFRCVSLGLVVLFS